MPKIGQILRRIRRWRNQNEPLNPKSSMTFCYDIADLKTSETSSIAPDGAVANLIDSTLFCFTSFFLAKHYFFHFSVKNCSPPHTEQVRGFADGSWSKLSREQIDVPSNQILSLYFLTLSRFEWKILKKQILNLGLGVQNLFVCIKESMIWAL